MTPEQEALRDGLASLPARLALVAGRLPDPDAPLAPGEWSAREVTLHLIVVEGEVWQARLDALVADGFPHWPWVEPGLWAGPGDGTFDGAARVLAAARAATIRRLDALDDAGWTRRGLHATLGELDVAGLMRIAVNHDKEHLAQFDQG